MSLEHLAEPGLESSGAPNGRVLLAIMVRRTVAALLVAVAATFSPARQHASPVLTRQHLFGGKKEGGGGGALGNVAGVMDQFKKAQEIAKKSQELQTE